jgi:FkbM family methyltransferase
MSIVSYAQNFEDVMLWRALGHIERGLYIDIGAQDPVVDSVSLTFHERGWRGVHVEPTPHYAELLRQQRPGDKIIQAAVGSKKGILPFFEIPHTGISTADVTIADLHRERGFDVHEISVPCITLATVFKDCQAQEIHWLKIDVEGLEEQVLRSWGAASARPWVVVVESTLPLTQTESHERWEKLLLDRHYSPVYFDGLNRYYVSEAHPELKPAFAVPPNVFDAFKLNGTASSTLHQLIDARHQSETREALEQHTRQRQDLQDEIERLSASIAALDAAKAQQESARTAHAQDLAAKLLRATTEAEKEKIMLALAHEDHEQSLHTAHKQQEAALNQRLQALEREQIALHQTHANRERVLVDQAAQAGKKMADLLQTQAQREREAQALAETLRGLQTQFADREKKWGAQVKAAEQQLRGEQAMRAKRAQQAATRLLAIHQQATNATAALADIFSADKAELQRNHAEQENQLKQQLEAAAIELAGLQQHAHALTEQHAEAARQLQGNLADAEKIHAQRVLELAGQLLESQRKAALENASQAKDFLLQERALRQQHSDQQGLLAGQLTMAQTDIERLLKYQTDLVARNAATLVELITKLETARVTYSSREQALTTQLLTNQQQAEKKSEELTLNHLKQERDWRAELAQRDSKHAAIKDQLNAKFSSELAIERERVREATNELLAQQHRSAKTAEEQTLQHLNEKRNLQLQLANSTEVLRTEVQRLNAVLAEQEHVWEAHKNSLCNDIQALRAEAYSNQQSSDAAEQQHRTTLSAERAERTRLLEACSALEAQLRNELVLEKSASVRLRHALEDVGRHLAETQATLSWRATASLRKLASLLNFRQTPHLNPSKTEQSIGSLEQAQPSPPFPALAEPSPATVTSEQSENHMPLPEQTTSSSPPPVALTMPELLARYDVDFVECAYRTLLGRAPDPEGLSYYLGRLRTGVPKMRTVMQLCESHEGKTHAAKVSGLDNALRQFRRQERPVLGWFVRQFEHREGINSVDRQLRTLDNQFWLFGNATAERLNRMEHSLAALHQSVLQQSQSIVADLGGTPNRTSNQTEFAAQRSALPEALKQISPRARDIYFQLKTASAIHGRRAA